ncbi:MAG: alpha/beta hydrolase [Dehalococcoidia bacterium]
MTTAAPFEDKTILLGALRFHFREWPNPGAPAALLLHGFTGQRHSFDDLGPLLQARYRVVALDQRGHGDSDWADDYATDRMAEDVDAFVDALRLAPVSLLGVSMGGRNAYTFAGRHPEKVARLALVDIGPETPAAGRARIQQVTQAKVVFDDPEEAVAAARAYSPRHDVDAVRQRVMTNVRRLDDGRWTWKYDPALHSRERRPHPDPETGWALLPRITCPVLLLHGVESDVLAPETAARMAREIADCRLIDIPGAGHAIAMDNPRAYVDAVQGFFLT